MNRYIFICIAVAVSCMALIPFILINTDRIKNKSEKKERMPTGISSGLDDTVYTYKKLKYVYSADVFIHIACKCGQKNKFELLDMSVEKPIEFTCNKCGKKHIRKFVLAYQNSNGDRAYGLVK